MSPRRASSRSSRGAAGASIAPRNPHSRNSRRKMGRRNNFWRTPIASRTCSVSSRVEFLYEAVGSRCRNSTRDETEQVRLAIGVLQKLFRRPIFLRELRECGFVGAIDAPAAPREERDEARRGLIKVGLQLPTNEPAYAVSERRNELRDEILRELIVDRFGMGTLVLETKQMKLTER